MGLYSRFTLESIQLRYYSAQTLTTCPSAGESRHLRNGVYSEVVRSMFAATL